MPALIPLHTRAPVAKHLLALAVCQAIATLAQAQEAQLQQVDVISTTPLPGLGAAATQVPANVQSITAREVEQQSVSNLADLLNNNLGPVSVSNGTGNPYQNDVSYRGFQATSLLGAPVGLSVYFDGVRMNEPFGSIVNWDLIPMNAISSVNVLPGSNPLFGLNTLGGAVVVNTKNGADDPGTDINLLAGSFRRRAFNVESGWVNPERHTDHFVSLNLDRQDGHRAHSGSAVTQGFGKSRWHSDDRRTDLEFSAALAQSRLHGTQALPLSMGADPRAAYTYPDEIVNRQLLLNAKASHWQDDNHFVNGNLFFRRSTARTVNSNAQLDDGCYDANGDLLATCANITGGSGTAPNTVAANPYGLARYTADINTSLVHASTAQNTVGGHLQWTSLEPWGARPNSLTLGLAADVSQIRYDQNAVLARLIDYQVLATPNLRYFFPATGGTSGSNVLSSVGLNATTRNLALFATDRLELSERLALTASGSYNLAVVNQRGANQQFLNTDGGYSWSDGGVSYYNPGYLGAQYYRGGTLTAITPATVAGLTPGPQSNALDGKHSYRRFNPSIGFNHNPSRALGLFGHYSESMRAPTSIELSCADPDRPCLTPTGFNGDPDLKAVVARTLEFGARGQWAPQWRWNIAAYLTRTSDDIQFIFSNASTGYFSNVGTTERKGVDMGLSRDGGPWQWRANLGFVRATYQSAFTTAQGVAVSPGDRIPGIPDLTLKLRGVYKPNERLTLGAGLVAARGQYAHGDEANNDPSGKVPGYATVNLNLQYTLDESLSLVGVVNNLLNRRYATYGVLGTNVYTGAGEQFRTPAAPRTLWVGISHSFGGKQKGGADRD